VGIVDLDILFQSPQKDERIIGWLGEEASSRGSAMEVNFLPKNCWEKTSFIGKGI
jgi:hypothetical protein